MPLVNTFKCTYLACFFALFLEQYRQIDAEYWKIKYIVFKLHTIVTEQEEIAIFAAFLNE